MQPDAQARLPGEAGMREYVLKSGIEVEPVAVRPSIWRRKTGGYLARVQALHPQTSKPVSRIKTLPTLGEALSWQVDERRAIASLGEEKPRQRMRFCEYVAGLLESKTARGEINSQATRETWASNYAVHLHPFFGQMFLDKIRRADVAEWFKGYVDRVGKGDMSPRTVNGLLGLLKAIFSDATEEQLIDESPAVGVRQLPTNRHRTYTREQPNSLAVGEMPELWAFLAEKKPRWYALIALGMCYGLRPSSLRPLRWRGPSSDIKWDEGILLIRQSHSRGQVVMDSTKTGEDLELPLDPEILDLLRWHVELYARDGSDLLFPGHKGFMSRNTIAYWFKVCEAKMRHAEWCPEARVQMPKKGEPRRKPSCTGCTEFGKHITPRAMRRSFYNLTARTAAQDAMIRSISGHKTPGMADRYRSQLMDGQAALMAEIIPIAQLRREKGLEATREMAREMARESGASPDRSASAQRRKSC
jgi:integrase